MDPARRESSLPEGWPRNAWGLLFEDHPCPMWVSDAETLAFLAVNRATVEQYGYSPDEFRRMSLLDIRPPEDVPSLVRTVARLGPGLLNAGTWRHRRKDGSLIQVAVTRSSLSWGGRRAYLVLAQDVTEERARQRALAESRERFALFTEHLPGCAYIKDAAGRYVYVNERAAQVLGREPADCLGRDDAEFFPSVAERLRAVDTSVLKSGLPAQLLERTERRGTTLTWLSAKFPIPGPEGPLLGGISIDITERVQVRAERDLLLERERAARREAETALERVRRFESVTEFALAQLELDDLLRELLGRVRTVLAADVATVLLLDEDRRSLTVRACVGLDPENEAEVPIPVNRGVAGRIAAARRPVVVDDLSQVEVLGPGLRSMRSLLGAPLMLEGRVIGVLHVATAARGRFDEHDVHLLQLVADRVAPAIDRARLIEQDRAARQRLQALTRRLVDTQEDERRRIARELHDEVGQLLTGLKLLLDTDPQPAPSSAQAHSLVGELLGRVRDLSMSLRPALLDDLGLVPALDWHLERYTAQTRVRVQLRHTGLERRLGAPLENAAFRIVQEALTNVARHAGVEAVSVRVEAVDGALRVQVEDRGSGFNPASLPGPTGGLMGMRERALALAGSLEVESTAGAGTRITAVLPLAGTGRTGMGAA